ncbi:palmitoyltransferase SWF1 SCDLUD_001722 [Saccharomycodes ludwigii]|uniref:palmitoyltransferase SWF1 n=1 Tax=Saccharomycodes ludwigii TaxID=36035 RepID=UPI001E860BB6|nr:hypothetical protein SCDLUD_001722 [Saccharomycodes ludwigii]KAH3901937.1 hypothetical protein SCDLUD_001722 [Saccharomycodes ludwigii]
MRLLVLSLPFFLKLIAPLIIVQIILLLFSPKYQRIQPFQWYYKKIYRPLLINPDSYRWKYGLVPLLYLSIYFYLAGYLYFYKISLYLDEPIWEVWGLAPILIVLPIIFGIKCVLSSYSTPLDSPKNFFFPYDNILYYPNTYCQTCKKVKPARSKHCSVCNKCIAFQDHHCIWLACCISGDNYKYFITFVFSNWLILTYGGLRLFFVITNSTNNYSGNRYLVKKYIFSLIILCILFSLVLTWFLYTQLMLIKDGMTTNESDKWFDVHELIRNKQLIQRISDGGYYYIYEKLSNKNSNSNFNKSQDVNTNCVYVLSLNSYDDKIYKLFRQDYEYVESPVFITNIYDYGGFSKNFKVFMG